MPFVTRQLSPNRSILITGMIGVSQGRREALVQAGHAIPPFENVTILVDTGASCTCVDPTTLKNLGLTPTGTTKVLTPSSGASGATKNLFDVSLVIQAKAGQPPLARVTVPVIESDLFAAQGFHVLMGMDILSHCHLTVDGQHGLFTLAY